MTESSMTILRRMLDERGVEYVEDYEYGKKYPPERSITWSCDIAGEDMTVTARDYCININDDGSADYCLDLEFHEVFTPEQAIAATLGRGTCHMEQTGHVKIAGVEYYDDDYECSECGAEMFEGYNYCPNCGRRVVEPTKNDVDVEVEQ